MTRFRSAKIVSLPGGKEIVHFSEVSLSDFGQLSSIIQDFVISPGITAPGWALILLSVAVQWTLQTCQWVYFVERRRNCFQKCSSQIEEEGIIKFDNTP